jgi:hypothetical protein
LVGRNMDVRKLISEHPSIIGITVGIIILLYIAVTILTTKRP